GAQSEGRAGSLSPALARLGFPEGWVRWLDPARAGRQAGVGVPWGGLWVPEALRVCPGELSATLLGLWGVIRRPVAIGSLAPADGGGWLLQDAGGGELGDRKSTRLNSSHVKSS